MNLKGGYQILDLKNINLDDAEDDTITIVSPDTIGALKGIAMNLLNGGKVKSVMIKNICKDSFLDGIEYGYISPISDASYSILFKVGDFDFAIISEYELVENEDGSIELQLSATISGRSDYKKVVNIVNDAISNAELESLTAYINTPFLTSELVNGDNDISVTFTDTGNLLGLHYISLLNSTFLLQIDTEQLSDSPRVITRGVLSLPYNDLGATRVVRYKVEASKSENTKTIKVYFDNDYKSAYAITGTVSAYMGNIICR